MIADQVMPPKVFDIITPSAVAQNNVAPTRDEPQPMGQMQLQGACGYRPKVDDGEDIIQENGHIYRAQDSDLQPNQEANAMHNELQRNESNVDFH